MGPGQGRSLAVLMGDLVASRAARSAAALHELFDAGVDDFNRRWRGRIVSPLTITLGDEFQGLLSDTLGAFELMQAMRMHFLAQDVECRFVLAPIRLDSPLNPARAWNMMGAGFSEARERLNDKADVSAYRFSFPAEPLIEASLEAHGYTLTYVEHLWTPTQRRYLIHFLTRGGHTMAQVAAELDVSSRNLYNVLRSAHRELYMRQCDTIREVLAALDARNEGAAGVVGA
jgi:hypothetical protein